MTNQNPNQKKIQVLDKGHVEYVNHMGDDLMVVNAARVSFAKESEWGMMEENYNWYPGKTEPFSPILQEKDRKLIAYLAKHQHWTPFAHPQICLRIKAPISIRTQLFKHKVGFCISGDTEITFVKIHKNKKNKKISSGIRKKTVSSLYEEWMKVTPHGKEKYGLRKRITKQNLRVLNTDTGYFEYGHIVDIVNNGEKDVFQITTKDGKTLKLTRDHRIYTKDGWHPLENAVGLTQIGEKYAMTKECHIGINGLKFAGTGKYQSYDWLKNEKDSGSSVQQMADKAGCSYHTIRKWLKIHNLKFDHLLNLNGKNGKPVWNKDLRGYSIFTLEDKIKHSKTLLEYYKQNPRKKQNTTWRQEVNRWTSQIAKNVHEKYFYTCQKCGCRNCKLNAHHVIPVLVDPTLAKDFDNLISVCKNCHTIIHKNEKNTKMFAEQVKNSDILITEWKKKKSTGNKLRVHFTEIVKIEYVGQETVYDITVDHPSHNFLANGMVVHNCENEVSRRYVTEEPEFYNPRWRTKPTNGAKQGSEDFMEFNDQYNYNNLGYDSATQHCLGIYHDLLRRGVAPEQARFILPQGTYTEWFWTGSLAAYARVCKLRSDPHAQWEVREYSTAISEIISDLFPESWKVLTAPNQSK